MLYPYFMVNQGNTKAVHGQVNLQGVFAIRCDVTGLWATLSCTVVDLSATEKSKVIIFSNASDQLLSV